MPLNRLTRTKEELDDLAVADAIASFIAVKQRDWVRRQRNRMIPAVMRMIDEARENGDTPNVKQIIEQAFLKGEVPLPELS